MWFKLAVFLFAVSILQKSNENLNSTPANAGETAQFLSVSLEGLRSLDLSYRFVYYNTISFAKHKIVREKPLKFRLQSLLLCRVFRKVENGNATCDFVRVTVKPP